MFCCWSCLLINLPSTTHHHERNEHKPRGFPLLQVLLSTLSISIALPLLHLCLSSTSTTSSSFFSALHLPSCFALTRIKNHPLFCAVLSCTLSPKPQFPSVVCHDVHLRYSLLRSCHVLAPHQYLCCPNCPSRTMYRELYTLLSTRGHEQCCASAGRCVSRPLL
jgi:hypothetical protein